MFINMFNTLFVEVLRADDDDVPGDVALAVHHHCPVHVVPCYVSDDVCPSMEDVIAHPVSGVAVYSALI